MGYYNWKQARKLQKWPLICQEKYLKLKKLKEHEADTAVQLNTTYCAYYLHIHMLALFSRITQLLVKNVEHLCGPLFSIWDKGNVYPL